MTPTPTKRHQCKSCAHVWFVGRTLPNLSARCANEKSPFHRMFLCVSQSCKLWTEATNADT